MTKVKFKITLFTFSVLLSMVWSVTAQSPSMPEYCLMTFEEFAYNGPRDRNEPRLPPRSPWVEHTALSQDANEKGYHLLEMVIVDERENITEIWFSAQQFLDTNETERIWVIYNPNSETAEYLSAELEVNNRPYLITELFVAHSGQIWGNLELNRNPNVDTTYEPLDTIYQPVLVYYDKLTEHFEVQDHVPQLAETQDHTILFDGETNFWIVSQGGIFSFDVSQTTDNQQFDFPEFEYIRATMGADDTIYIQNLLARDSVVVNQFSPLIGELQPLPPLDQEWPAQNGLLVSNDGIIWLGASGYLNLSGDWQLLHTNVEAFYQNEIHYGAASPFPVLESSDGKFWFVSNWIDGYYNYVGTAWYDVSTTEGCMFTNLPSTVLEDDNNIIWMLSKEIVSGTLYSVNLGDL
jgi:hypothetical protein